LKATIKRKLEAAEQKQRVAAVTRIQAHLRGLKQRALHNKMIAALVDLKSANEQESELRKEQARVLEQQKRMQEQLEEESRLAQARAEEKNIHQAKIRSSGAEAANCRR